MGKLLDAIKAVSKKFRDRIYGRSDIRGKVTSKDPVPASRYLWVSKEVPAGVHKAIHFGRISAGHPLVRRIMRQTKGSTYNTGTNEAKRKVDSMFGSNKLRRRARARFRGIRDNMLAKAA